VHTRQIGKHVQDDHYTLQDNHRICKKLDERLPLASVGYNDGSWTLERAELQKISTNHNSK
jgi:hypothetical protein